MFHFQNLLRRRIERLNPQIKYSVTVLLKDSFPRAAHARTEEIRPELQILSLLSRHKILICPRYSPNRISCSAKETCLLCREDSTLLAMGGLWHVGLIHIPRITNRLDSLQIYTFDTGEGHAWVWIFLQDALDASGASVLSFHWSGCSNSGFANAWQWVWSRSPTSNVQRKMVADTAGYLVSNNIHHLRRGVELQKGCKTTFKQILRQNACMRIAWVCIYISSTT